MSESAFRTFQTASSLGGCRQTGLPLPVGLFGRGGKSEAAQGQVAVLSWKQVCLGGFYHALLSG